MAENCAEAIKVFRKHYPDKHEGIVNCCDIYSEDYFSKTCMVDGNLGAKCHAFYRQPLSNNEFLCESGDRIDNAVFEAIKAVAYNSSDVDWDMSIIGEITDLIEDTLIECGVNTCHPWQDENECICYSTAEKCSFCNR